MITAIQLYAAYQRDLKGIKDRFAEFRAAQLPILTNSVWIFDDALIRIQLDGLSRLPDIENVSVLIDGKVKWSAGIRTSHEIMTERFPLAQHDSGKDIVIGTFEATAGLDGVHDRLIDKVVAALVSNAVTSLLIAVFALALFQLTVTRHLYRLADYARRIDLDRSDAEPLRLDRKPGRRHSDVLDRLVDTINTMRTKLTGAYAAARANEARMRRESHHLAALLHDDALRGGGNFAAVTETVAAVLGVASVGIWRLDPDHRLYRCIDRYDAALERHVPDSDLPVESFRHFLAALNRDLVLAVPDILADDRYREFAGHADIARATLDAGVPVDGRLGAIIRAQPADAARPWMEDEINFMGAIAALVSASIETQDKQAAQRELSQHKDQLEEIVARRTAELTAANLETKQTLAMLRTTQHDLIEHEKLASLGSVVAGIAHEVNTPIGIGVTAASSLKHATVTIAEKLATNRLKRSDLTGYFDIAERSADILEQNLARAAELIRSFKLIAVDQADEAVRVIELRNYTGDVLASLQPTLRKAGHRLEIGDGEPIKLETAPSALWQIISNLVMNSMLHAFEPDQHGVLRLDIDRVGDTAILTYRDNGKGMPAEIRHRIFEPFFTTKRGQGGSGLGLSIVYNLATQTLGGTIACETKPGAGTEFVITIPIRGRKSGSRTSAA